MNPALIGVPAAAALTSGITTYAAVYPRSQLFGATIRSTAAPPQLALTFDDGPNPAVTPLLLDLLDKYKAKATFFLIGRFVRTCPELAKEVANRGHLIGNHTQTHPNLFWLSPRAIRNELRQCQSALQDVVGAAAKSFRPPYGLRNPWVVGTARELGMQTVMWTLLPGDWREKSVEWLTRRMSPIADHAQDSANRAAGDVLCLHDGAHRQLNGDRIRTLQALEYWFPRWRDLGLKFVTIGEAANTPPH
jgi:peptidoglycan/xylan/chitin deacetylase (PgdA/CDA1 family)